MLEETANQAKERRRNLKLEGLFLEQVLRDVSRAEVCLLKEFLATIKVDDELRFFL